MNSTHESSDESLPEIPVVYSLKSENEDMLGLLPSKQKDAKAGKEAFYDPVH